MNDLQFDVSNFRQALGQFPTGVTVITTKDEQGKPVGVTASSFNSVSLDPALVLWSVAKEGLSSQIMQNAKHFAVNVLSSDQADVSNNFASSSSDKFEGVSYSEDTNGSPLLENCAAQFECDTWNVYEGGDHLIIVGQVKEFRQNPALSPLVFCAGAYASLADKK